MRGRIKNAPACGSRGEHVRGCGSLCAEFADSLDEPGEVCLAHIANVADAEGVGLGNLARIDDESLGFELVVKVFEIEVLRGIIKRSDDRRLPLVGQEGAEAQCAHPADQRAVVLGVAGVAGSDAAFGVELAEGLHERPDYVGRRGEAPFAVAFFHCCPLVIQVERE